MNKANKLIVNYLHARSTILGRHETATSVGSGQKAMLRFYIYGSIYAGNGICILLSLLGSNVMTVVLPACLGSFRFERLFGLRESRKLKPSFSNFRLLVPSLDSVHFSNRSVDVWVASSRHFGKTADGRSSPNRAYDSVRGVKILVFQFL